MSSEGSEPIERLAAVDPPLREPVLVAGFQGWNDAGQAATAAVRWLAHHLGGTRVASLRPDSFHVFTNSESRPIVRLRDGERVIRWPSHDLYAIRGGSGWQRDLLALVAREPDLRWRHYAGSLLEFARGLGTNHVVTLGAFLAAVPHTRPVPISGYAWGDDEAGTLRSLGAFSTSYEGPTGIVSAFADSAHALQLRSTSLWAAVPHYLPTTANPKAALALLRTVRDLTDLPLDLARLEDAAAFFEGQVTDAVRSREEVADHVKELEATAEHERSEQGGELPAAAEVIKAFEELLRRGRGESPQE